MRDPCLFLFVTMIPDTQKIPLLDLELPDRQWLLLHWTLSGPHQWGTPQHRVSGRFWVRLRLVYLSCTLLWWVHGPVSYPSDTFSCYGNLDFTTPLWLSWTLHPFHFHEHTLVYRSAWWLHTASRWTRVPLLFVFGRCGSCLFFFAAMNSSPQKMHQYWEETLVRASVQNSALQSLYASTTICGLLHIALMQR